MTDLASTVEDRSELVGALGRLIDLRDGYLGVDTQEVVRLATAIGGRVASMFSTMPRSVMGRLISGSLTRPRAA